MKVVGDTLVAQTLSTLGATHVYSVPGTPIRETVAKCAEAGLRPIGVRHQQAGALMSIAQNYVSGNVASAVILSAGPAITNAATAILVAKDNCWPLVVIGGRRPLDMRGMGSFQELDGVELYRSITKWSAVVERTAQIPEFLERAFHVALGGRPGPVYLDLPEDVLTATAEAAFSPTAFAAPATADPEAIRHAADLLAQAQRPALIIGKGVRWSEPYGELRRLVDEWGVPFITSPMGRGYLPDDHPLCGNDARRLLQSQADVVLIVGARLDWTFRFGSELARDANIIQIDIDESAIGLNRAAAVGIVGDSKQALSALLFELDKLPAKSPPRDLSPWQAALDRERCTQREKLRGLMLSDRTPMSPYRMLKELGDFQPRDGITILDGSVFMMAAQQVLPSFLPASRFTPAHNGCLGVGIPFAIGAKLAAPRRSVLAVCGDTAFSFNAMDVETAVRHQIPVVIVVVNNEGNMGAFVDQTFFPMHKERIGRFQPGVRFERIVESLGGYGELVEQPEQLRPALTRAAASGATSCINVRVDPDAPYPQD